MERGNGSAFYLAFLIIIPIDSYDLAVVKGPFALMGNYKLSSKVLSSRECKKKKFPLGSQHEDLNYPKIHLRLYLTIMN